MNFITFILQTHLLQGIFMFVCACVTSAGSSVQAQKRFMLLTSSSLEFTTQSTKGRLSRNQSEPPSTAMPSGILRSPRRHMCVSHSQKRRSRPCLRMKLRDTQCSAEYCINLYLQYFHLRRIQCINIILEYEVLKFTIQPLNPEVSL